MAVVPPAAAQSQVPASPVKFQIADNSFLVEEAFNQEPGIFQNIFVLTRSRHGAYDMAFTQEWPVRSQRHQFSYTVPVSVASGQSRMGDVLINYRFQAATEEGHPAFAPRVSLIVPTSAEARSLGSRGVGWQVNLPFSKQAGAVYVHWNGGATWRRLAESDGLRASAFAAASAILVVRPMFHLMLESVLASDSVEEGRARTVIIVPGFRSGWNLGERQLIIGAGLAVTRGDERDVAALIYCSYELPFLRTR